MSNLKFYCLDCLHTALLRDEDNFNRQTPYGSKILKIFCHDMEFEVVIPRFIYDRKVQTVIYVGKLPEIGEPVKPYSKPQKVRKLML